MGLDLVVESCPKPGHEAEWRSLVAKSFADEPLTEDAVARFREISIPPFERLGAPRVGYDAAADAWIIEAQQARTPEDVAAVLKNFHGYHVLRLVTSDGLPDYTHAGLYEGVDETSFRGAFLSACGDVLSKNLIGGAWTHKFPEEAAAYGRALLAAADAASASPPVQKPTLLSRLGLGRKAREFEVEEQLNIVRAAGRWFVFWGERGHPVRAWT
jgi:hypothetical protein